MKDVTISTALVESGIDKVYGEGNKYYEEVSPKGERN